MRIEAKQNFNYRENATGFDGLSFSAMSDEFLVQTFNTLCERTAESNAHPEDWIPEWNSCRDELMNRLRSNDEVSA